MPQSFSSCNGVDVGATAACPWQFTKITHLYLVWRQNFFEPSGQISLFSSTWSLQLANPVSWNTYFTSQQAFLHIYSKIQRDELLCGKKKKKNLLKHDQGFKGIPQEGEQSWDSTCHVVPLQCGKTTDPRHSECDPLGGSWAPRGRKPPSLLACCSKPWHIGSCCPCRCYPSDNETRKVAVAAPWSVCYRTVLGNCCESYSNCTCMKRTGGRALPSATYSSSIFWIMVTYEITKVWSIWLNGTFKIFPYEIIWYRPLFKILNYLDIWPPFQVGIVRETCHECPMPDSTIQPCL